MGPGLCLDYTCKADLPCRDVVADQALGDEGPFPNLQVLCPSAGPLQWGLQPPPTTAFPSHCSAGQLLSLFPCTVCTPRRCSSARGRPFTALGAGRTSEMPAKQKPMPIPGRQAQEPRQDSDPRSEFCHSGNKGQSRRHWGTDRFGKNFLDWCKRTGTAQFGASKSEGPKGEGPLACLLPRLMAVPL